jgi:hypothetical protein
MATRRKTRRKRLLGSPVLGGSVEPVVPRTVGGEEARGGIVTTPGPDEVDALGEAVGVSRALDEPLRASSEIVGARDQTRGEQEE